MFTFNNGSIASHCHICKHLGKTSKLNLFQLQSGHHSLFQRVLFMFSLVADLFSPHFIYFFPFYCETRTRPGSQINTCTASQDILCGTYACVDVFFMCTHKRAEEIRRGREPGQFKIGKNNVEPRFHYPLGYCTHTVDSLFIEQIFTTALRATQTKVGFLQQCAVWWDEWLSDFTLLIHEFCNTSHKF